MAKKNNKKRVVVPPPVRKPGELFSPRAGFSIPPGTALVFQADSVLPVRSDDDWQDKVFYKNATIKDYLDFLAICRGLRLMGVFDGLL